MALIRCRNRLSNGEAPTGGPGGVTKCGSFAEYGADVTSCVCVGANGDTILRPRLVGDGETVSWYSGANLHDDVFCFLGGDKEVGIITGSGSGNEYMSLFLVPE